ncbi:MAG: ATP-binding protein [Muribaculaceae bacterium]|nr:ATP-binding protein [Muribaculaceae bacterium]
MLFRKIEKDIRQYLEEQSNKILLIEGARQIGKSYIIRYVGKNMFPNFVEINLVADKQGPRYFENIKTTEDFYLVLSSLYGFNLNNSNDTLVFIDEIQEYPHLLTLLKFLCQENKYRYIASGSLLGVTLKRTTSIPIGSIQIKEMYPLDFEEFLIANNIGIDTISYLKGCYEQNTSPNSGVHERILSIFKRYLVVGGMPDAVNEFLATKNIAKIREIQNDIHRLYGDDATKYDKENKLKIKRIYNLLPSFLAQKKKRLVFKDIEDVKGKRSREYEEEIDYLIDSGITLKTKAISNPKFPLLESEQKNLLKLYLNDVGIISGILYKTNIKPLIDNETSVNLGAVYECVVAMELKSLGHSLFYYDNKKYGEVDFLIDDYALLSVVPIEVKSGKDYRIHSSLSRFVTTEEYGIKEGVVLSNSGEIHTDGKIRYLPVYMSMFLGNIGKPVEIDW